MPDDDLTSKQKMFCRYYVRDLNAASAARACGSRSKNARQSGYKMLQNEKVAARIKQLQTELCRELKIEAKQIHEVAAAIALHDASKISQMRHVSCEHCWPNWYENAAMAEKEARELAEAMGEEFQTENLAEAMPDVPDQICQRCHGRGIISVWFADTRDLSRMERMAFSAASIGRDGYKVEIGDRLRALGSLSEQSTTF
jgi:phage terminase small subunit